MKLGFIPLYALLTIFIPLFAYSATSATEISSRPILFIHGFNPFGLPEDCKKDWGLMEASLSSQGYTGPMVTLGYYAVDTNCDVKTSPHGSILTHISDLSKDLAWYVYDQYSSKNISVDVVAHSMGGLVLRYALYRSSVGDPNFPPYLLVSHAATLASPFTGYSLVAEACHVNPLNIQCDDMFPYSSFIQELKDPAALVPQGRDGTLWNNTGSNADFTDSSDGFVGSASATSMNIPGGSKTVLPWHMFVFHTRYTHNKTVIANVARFLASRTQEEMETGALSRLSQAVTANKNFSSALAPHLSFNPADAVISRDEISQDLSQISDEEKPAKTEPYFENGEPAGVRFTRILPDGLFDKMGIQENDVIRGCNGDDVNSPFEALQGLDDESTPVEMNFCIMRNGVSLTRKVVIE